MTKIVKTILGEAMLLGDTAKRVAKVLGDHGIPHLIIGGFAVQQYGYARFTCDVDIIVPNVDEARDVLSINGFAEKPGSSMTVVDRTNRIDVDLLPGGKAVSKHALINLPMPTEVTTTPKVVTIEELIDQKLSTYLKNRGSRIKDAADVQQLIILNNLPRTMKLDLAVKAEYEALYDAYHAEKTERGE